MKSTSISLQSTLYVSTVLNCISFLYYLTAIYIWKQRGVFRPIVSCSTEENRESAPKIGLRNWFADSSFAYRSSPLPSHTILCAISSVRTRGPEPRLHTCPAREPWPPVYEQLAPAAVVNAPANGHWYTAASDRNRGAGLAVCVCVCVCARVQVYSGTAVAKYDAVQNGERSATRATDGKNGNLQGPNSRPENRWYAGDKAVAWVSPYVMNVSVQKRCNTLGNLLANYSSITLLFEWLAIIRVLNVQLLI